MVTPHSKNYGRIHEHRQRPFRPYLLKEPKRIMERDRQRRKAALKKSLKGQSESVQQTEAPALSDKKMAVLDSLPPDERQNVEQEHAAWLAIRQEFISTCDSLRAQGIKVNPETAPHIFESFKFLPVHGRIKRDANKEWECAAECRSCLWTPMGPRNSLYYEEWKDSPYRCDLIPDIPDKTFWPTPELQQAWYDEHHPKKKSE